MNVSRSKIVRRRRGLTLIEVALSLAVIAMILVGLSQLMANGTEYLRSRTVAERLEQVTSAARSYVQANYAELMAIPGLAGGSVYVPVTGAAGPSGAPTLPSIQGGGYLASTFVDENAYGQSHGLVLRGIDTDGDGASDRLEGVVTTIGGLVIPDRVLGQVAGFLGADGGFMFTNPLPSTANQITGVAGGWRAPAATWSAGVAVPTVGHVMSSMAFNEGTLVGDYLNRHDIGIEEANTMRTDLHMGNNAVTDVTLVTGNGNTVTMGTDGVEIGPNLRVSGYITAGGDITSDANVTGVKFIDKDNPNYFADPSSKSTLFDVDADRLSTDALIYNTNSAANQVRLRDRLPNYVSKAGWLVTGDDQRVTKPDCPGNGVPKITYAAISDSYQFASNVRYGSSTNANGVPSLYNDNIAIARKYLVTDAGSEWRIRHSGTDLYNGIFTGLAMTYCYYPD